MGKSISNDSSFGKLSDKIIDNHDLLKYRKFLLKREIKLINFLFSKYFEKLNYDLEKIILNKKNILFHFIFLFKDEFTPNKKIFSIRHQTKNTFKDNITYKSLKYVYYFLINLFFYPKNLYIVFKTILKQKYCHE